MREWTALVAIGPQVGSLSLSSSQSLLYDTQNSPVFDISRQNILLGFISCLVSTLEIQGMRVLVLEGGC